MKRPSQRCIQHPPLIDYLVWPGLRERFIFNPLSYCSEKFPKMFWPHFRFTWEYDFGEAYVCDRQTGVYQFSDPFLERTRELQNYRMSATFLAEFPELEADIQAALPPPDFITIDYEEAGNGRDIGTSHGFDSLCDPFLEAKGFSQNDWSRIQANMRVGKF